MATLRELFDACDWSDKTEGRLPDNMDDARFAWRHGDEGYAQLFLKSGLYPERSSAVIRSMYLGTDRHGAETLVVMETTNPEYDPKFVAQGIGAMMSADKIKAAFKNIQGDE